jgi:hypothetical protein
VTTLYGQQQTRSCISIGLEPNQNFGTKKIIVIDANEILLRAGSAAPGNASGLSELAL